MSAVWFGVAGLAFMNFVFKAAGPVLLAGRQPPPWLTAVIDATGQCLLASLVTVSLIGSRGVELNAAVLAGVAVAVALRLAKVHELVCVLLAALVVAGIRVAA